MGTCLSKDYTCFDTLKVILIFGAVLGVGYLFRFIFSR